MSDTPKKRKSIWQKIARYDWPPNWPVVEDTRPSAPPMIVISNLSLQPAHPRPTAPSAFLVITILHRTERFIGLLIAAIMGIIAITTVAAVSGVALHQMVQTIQFVQ